VVGAGYLFETVMLVSDELRTEKHTLWSVVCGEMNIQFLFNDELLSRSDIRDVGLLRSNWIKRHVFYDENDRPSLTPIVRGL
jgi:hypothetical protein